MDVVVVNLEAVQSSIDRVRRNIETKMNEFLKKLADIGIERAKFRFSVASYDGVNDVVVEDNPEWLGDNTLAIKAYGQSILFIEFGTGTLQNNPVTHPMADELGMKRGSYGHGQGKNPNGWRYKGEPGTNGIQLSNGRVWTKGNNANRCMWNAAEAIRERIYETAREVFYS